MDNLPRLWDALAAQTFADFEIFVLDNASTDGSANWISERASKFPRPVHVVRLEKNIGFSAGHDRLFAMSSSPYVFCVNQDAVPDREYLSELVAFMDAHPDAGAAAGKLVRDASSGGIIDSAGLELSWTCGVYDIGAGEIDNGDYDGVREVFGVSGALPLYRRSAAAAASPDGALFDAEYFAYKEDVDLAWRLQLAGFKAYVVGAATGIHVRSMGKGRRREAWRQRLSVRNHILTLVKDLPPSQAFRIPAIIVYEALKALYLAVHSFKSLGGYADAWRHLPNARKMRKVIQSRSVAKINYWFSRHGRR